MVINESSHQRAYLLSIGGHLLTLLMCQHNVLDFLHLGGGALVTQAVEVGIDVVGSKDVHRSTIKFNKSVSMGETALISRTRNGDEGRHTDANLLNAVSQTADNLNGVAVHIHQTLSISHLGDVQFLSHLRTYLCGIAIDGLTTTKDEVDLTHLLHGKGEGIAGGQGV